MPDSFKLGKTKCRYFINFGIEPSKRTCWVDEKGFIKTNYIGTRFLMRPNAGNIHNEPFMLH